MADKWVAARWEPASWWGAMLLGIVLVGAGVYVLADVAFVKRISAIVLGVVLLVAGGAEILHAFSAAHWRGAMLRLVTGVLYAIAGLMLVANPAAASLILTFLLGVALLASGAVRVIMAYQYWRWYGWLLLVSGLIGIGAGLVILGQWPATGVGVIGFLVGADLVVHGVWWILLGWHTYAGGDEPAVPSGALSRH